MGVTIREVEEHESGFEPVADLVVIAPEELRPFSISGPMVPRTIDELVVLSVLATRAKGVSEIRDAAELRVKESDRIAATAANLRAMGAEVETLEDGLRIAGPQALRGAPITTHGDHRIAMALGVAGLFASGETTIDDSGCASVSYPKFFEALESLAVR
jgi:3-phosphoshikimate 1-carboxyvinyltransferase